jgi:hypothetical protein
MIQNNQVLKNVTKIAYSKKAQKFFTFTIFLPRILIRKHDPLNYGINQLQRAVIQNN